MTLMIYLLAASAYVWGSGLSFDVGRGRRLSAAPGMLALLLILAGRPSSDPWHLLVVCVLAVAAEISVAWILRQELLRAVAHSVVLAVLVYLAHLSGAASFSFNGTNSSLLFLMHMSAPILLAAMIESAISVERSSLRSVLFAVRSDFGYAAMMVSLGGLLVMAARYWGPASIFAVMLPTYLSRREFQGFGKARSAYDQTIAAFGKLTEVAGLSSPGHHTRVAASAIQIAEQLGISEERKRALELVAQLHDVGLVTLPDPVETGNLGDAAILELSKQVVRETHLLAPYESFLDWYAPDAPIEASILRVANEIDQQINAEAMIQAQLEGASGLYKVALSAYLVASSSCADVVIVL